jgi:hypothetical protein
MSLAVVCEASSFRGVFIHGVLTAFEEAGLPVQAYSAASSMTIPTAYAAVGKLPLLEGVEYWKYRVAGVRQYQNDMSYCIKKGIEMALPDLIPDLFQPGAKRFFVGASEVITEEAAQLTQSDKAARLGRKLMVDAARKDRSWALEHLRPALFDTAAVNEMQCISAENLADVLYASTRLLNGWKEPASVSGRPFLDGVYSCGIPVMETAGSGFQTIVAVSAAPPPLFTDMFQTTLVPSRVGMTQVFCVHPERPGSHFEVSLFDATEAGLEAFYTHGIERGRLFLQQQQAS